MYRFDGDFYDEDYFQRGKQSGKGWLENYRWLPRRTFKEAFAFIDRLNLNDDSKVLEFGCSYGFLVKALRILNINADGCDISQHALSKAPEGCWNCEKDEDWLGHIIHEYTDIIFKDVLEHLNINQLEDTLDRFSWVANRFMGVVPLGDNGIYRIPEYHTEISHLIAENEEWWKDIFNSNGWDIVFFSYHISGLKDNWYSVNPYGNAVFVAERKA